MDNETSRIANAILRGKQNNDYLVHKGNKIVSLQDYLADSDYISAVSTPLINNVVTITNPIEFNGGINLGIPMQRIINEFPERFNNKHNFLDEDIKKQVSNEFNKYTFSDIPELKSVYFCTLGTIREVQRIINLSANMNIATYLMNEAVVPGINRILNSTEKFDDVVDFFDFTLTKLNLQNQIETFVDDKNNIYSNPTDLTVLSLDIEKNLSRMGYELRTIKDFEKTAE